MRHILSFLSVIALTACTSVPEQIAVGENTKLIPYDIVNKETVQSELLGEKARWGGKIVKVENKQSLSEIEVVFFPESNSGKPRLGEESPGRFKALVEGFVDPLVFEEGRLITVVGNVGDLQAGIIGEQNYAYPTINAEGYYMWRKSKEIEVEQIGFTPFLYGRHYPNGFFSPWYDPFWGHSGRHRYRVIYNDGHSQGSRAFKPATPRKPAKPKPKPKREKPLISEPKPTPRPNEQDHR